MTWRCTTHLTSGGGSIDSCPFCKIDEINQRKEPMEKHINEAIERIQSLVNSNITATGEGELEIESSLWIDFRSALQTAWEGGREEGYNDGATEMREHCKGEYDQT